MKAASPYNGILLMNKPQGFTSHDVVAKLRGICKTRRIGHGGTLDPMATGVLPVFLGGATRAADFAAAQEKGYTAGFALGFATDTQDTTGAVVRRADKRVTRTEVEAAMTGFLGRQTQLPPMYSAVQVNGQRLYDLARKGIEVERPTREIEVTRFALLDFDEAQQTGRLEVVCSKGTYVRTLINDLGERLGTLAAMSSLVRTRAGDYTLDETVDFDTVQRAADAGTLDRLLRPTDSLFMEHPAVELDDYGAARADNGAFIVPAHAAGCPQTPGTLCRVYHRGAFRMLGRVDTLDRGGVALFTYKNFR